ncbi:hypothetical protein LY474_02165 [Myxococcus stipitatus]|uniref:hypothetical protein n=1 Tax=Myxococcus stipitatus TaxID=83455 RepID=UPI001F308A49|nr:hypothetical protein [Myxococcus stipitatus]MCE9666605.1 hypothetical protein [Myxococcus stipitatus]
MKVHLSFKAANEKQIVHLVSGDRWSNTFRREGNYPTFFGAAQEPTKDHHRVVQWVGGWNKVKDVQWLDVPALDGTKVQARLADLVAQAHDVGAKAGLDDEDLVDFDSIRKCYQEITGAELAEQGHASRLCHLMLSRTAKALQFDTVYIKPYTTYEGDESGVGKTDVGYVRIRGGTSCITAEEAEGVLVTLKSAKNWFLRHTFVDGAQSLVRKTVDDSNPYRSGMVHYRVRGFVDEPSANMTELLFTYIHEVSHCWANARDNVSSDYPQRAMYIRRWATGEESTTLARARKDPTLLLTSADFMAYVLLRRAGLIDPGFLARPDWKDA